MYEVYGNITDIVTWVSIQGSSNVERDHGNVLPVAIHLNMDEIKPL